MGYKNNLMDTNSLSQRVNVTETSNSGNCREAAKKPWLILSQLSVAVYRRQ